MTLRSSIAALVILAATASWGQSSAGPLAARRPNAVASSNNADPTAAAARAKAQANQHVQDMGATLAKMHTLLKEMRTRTSATAPKDSMAKANLEMWSLMLEQLDKQYEQLVAATKAREDFEARRQAMYKQADEKAAAAASAARAAQQRKAGEQANSSAGTPASTPAAGSTSSPAAATPTTTPSPN